MRAFYSIAAVSAAAVGLAASAVDAVEGAALAEPVEACAQDEQSLLQATRHGRARLDEQRAETFPGLPASMRELAGKIHEGKLDTLRSGHGSALAANGKGRITDGARPVDCQPNSNSAEFSQLLVKCTLLASSSNMSLMFAHEAPVYLPSMEKVLFASNRFGSGEDQFIQLYTITVPEGKLELLPEAVWRDEIVMSNGGILDWYSGLRTHPAGVDSVLIASQGNKQKSSGVYRLNLKTLRVDLVLNQSRWEGANFNSLNDLVLDPVKGGLLFTDPWYGFFQGFRPSPMLGNWVWHYAPGSTPPDVAQDPAQAALVADLGTRPNGIAFTSERGDELLVTDSGYFPGADSVSDILLQQLTKSANGSDLINVSSVLSATDPASPRAIYKFDVVRDEAGRVVTLSKRRNFIIAQAGVPDGVKVDCAGRIYVGEGNGVAVYSPEGRLLGVLKTTMGCANIVLIPRGRKTELVALCETEVFSFTLRTQTCSLGRAGLAASRP